MSIPAELQKEADRIAEIARGFGLDFYHTIFELVSYEELNQVASYGGFPIRYPHWRFGMEYEKLEKGHVYGLSKIYELVINNDPCYAYLMDTNALVDQKLVMAHVYGHADFFKNNLYFSKTNRRMMDQMANHGDRIRRYIDRHGLERVETFLDGALSIENLIDPHWVVADRRRPARVEEDEESMPSVRKIPSKEYMDSFVNPEEFMELQRRKLAEEQQRRRRFPERPERDVLAFLMEYAPIERWQRDILGIVREEGYYFAPQGMTKIMNEGWASYWHSRILTEKVLDDSEIVDYADHAAAVFSMPPGSFNPYKIGVELWRDIERRWDRGQFGPEFEECDDLEARASWDTGAGLGQEKIFEVRKLHNDITFIDTFLTADFCNRNQLFVSTYNERTKRYEISDRDFSKIKAQLLWHLTNSGQPIIAVENGNFENRGELLLLHDHQGVDLDLAYAEGTLRNIQRVWGRPVNIGTVVGGKPKILTHDGESFQDRDE
ncbi:MAG: SpoVR family protein [Candidatus Eisenbacteria bacterium]|nr:SpoVR family protein [Candidatus Latescibacterota bacterium]MBD3301696.1 SpoVR family protein [Candidatus Eisenbacteria bacterium]